MIEHESAGNETTPEGIVHRCSCGWVSRACFSNAVASVLGAEHRADAEGIADAAAEGTADADPPEG